MTQHNLTYNEFVLLAQKNGIFELLVEITNDIPEGMRHTYAHRGERISGCFGTTSGTWFNKPLKFDKKGRKFRKEHI